MAAREGRRAAVAYLGAACLTGLAAPAVAPAQVGEPIRIQVENPTPGARRVPTDEYPLDVRVRYALAEEGYVTVKRVQLTLPPALRCGGREDSVAVEREAMVGRAPPEEGVDSVAAFRLHIPEAEGACLTTAGLVSGGSEGEVTVRYYLAGAGPEDRTTTISVQLQTSAALWVVILGALAGVLLANLVLRFAVRTLRLKAEEAPRDFWSEVAFGALITLILVLLVRMLLPGDQPWFVRVVRGESFGHGVLLGLGYQPIATRLVAFIRGKLKDESAPTGSGPTNPEGRVG